MAKEFFKAHFFPEQYGRAAWFTNSLIIICRRCFQPFPFPQREAGIRDALRYAGAGEPGMQHSHFPEGRRSETGEIDTFVRESGYWRRGSGSRLCRCGSRGSIVCSKVGWKFRTPR